MIAYSKQWLNSIDVQEQLEEAFEENCITKTENDAACLLYSSGFYSPNIFIRIGLYILTIVIASFSFGLLALVFSSSSEFTIGGLAIFFGFVCYALLEFMVHSKQHYRSGVDDALLLLTGIAILSGINIIGDVSSAFNSLFILIIAVYGTLRFADSVMSFIAVIALMAFVFFSLSPIGNIARALLPFILMIISAVLYFLSRQFCRKKQYLHYRSCLKIIEITALVCFYAAGNYYVVREAGNSFFNLQLQPAGNIPFAWIFWIFTISIPVLYITGGIFKKDIVLIRTGLLLVAAMVFTVRYYYHMLPAETVMTLAGIFMIVISYLLIKYLKQPVAGFTAQAISKNEVSLKHIEAIIIAETLSQGQQQQTTRFGGGSFGGAGASDDF